MPYDTALIPAGRVVHRLRWVTGILAVIAAIALAAAIAWPMSSVDAEMAPTPQHSVRMTDPPVADVKGLIVRLAGRPLIRAAQARAAVKDTGAAAQLLKRLKLQGVVDMAGTPVAYVQVEQEGIKTVRQGDRLLDFVVESMGTSEVTLTLDGVQVQLKH